MRNPSIVQRAGWKPGVWGTVIAPLLLPFSFLLSSSFPSLLRVGLHLPVEWRSGLRGGGRLRRCTSWSCHAIKGRCESQLPCGGGGDGDEFHPRCGLPSASLCHHRSIHGGGSVRNRKGCVREEAAEKEEDGKNLRILASSSSSFCPCQSLSFPLLTSTQRRCVRPPSRGLEDATFFFSSSSPLALEKRKNKRMVVKGLGGGGEWGHQSRTSTSSGRRGRWCDASLRHGFVPPVPLASFSSASHCYCYYHSMDKRGPSSSSSSASSSSTSTNSSDSASSLPGERGTADSSKVENRKSEEHIPHHHSSTSARTSTTMLETLGRMAKESSSIHPQSTIPHASKRREGVVGKETPQHGEEGVEKDKDIRGGKEEEDSASVEARKVEEQSRQVPLGGVSRMLSHDTPLPFIPFLFETVSEPSTMTSTTTTLTATPTPVATTSAPAAAAGSATAAAARHEKGKGWERGKEPSLSTPTARRRATSATGSHNNDHSTRHVDKDKDLVSTGGDSASSSFTRSSPTDGENPKGDDGTDGAAAAAARAVKEEVEKTVRHLPPPPPPSSSSSGASSSVSPTSESHSSTIPPTIKSAHESFRSGEVARSFSPKKNLKKERKGSSSNTKQHQQKSNNNATGSAAAPPSPPAKAATTGEGKPPASCQEIPIWRVVQLVWSYVWPAGNWKMKVLVVSSVGCVLIGKTLKVMIPFAFKGIVDSLSAVASTTTTTSTAATAAAGVTTTTTTAVTTGSGGAASVATATSMIPLTSIPFTLTVTGFLLAYGVCRVAGSFAEELKNVLFAPVGGAGTTNLAMQTMRKLHSLDLPYHLNREIGVLSKDLDRGSRAFWNFAYILLFLITPTLFEMCLVGTALYTQGGSQFILVGTTAIIAYVVWTFSITNWRAKFRTRFNFYDSKVGGHVVDSLMNYETVKYFGSEKYECDRIEKEMKSMNHQLVLLDQSIALLNMGQQLIFAAATVGSLYMASCGVLTGAMTVGDLVLVDGLLLQLYMPLSYLGMIYRDIQSSTQNMQAMLSIMDAECTVKDSPGARPYQHKDGTIEFRRVSFEYLAPTSSSTGDAQSPGLCAKNTTTSTTSTSEKEETEMSIEGHHAEKELKQDEIEVETTVEKKHKNKEGEEEENEEGMNRSTTTTTTSPDNDNNDSRTTTSSSRTSLVPSPSSSKKKRFGVLHEINFIIPGGSVVAFVGPSGSGKSTIFRLLFRFFNPSDGMILLDGQPLNELQIQSVRQHIGVIPQDPSLFNHSIRYNISYGRSTPTSEEEVIEASRGACLHETLMAMPEGYETSVGERGCKLSGGEKQRVAIARALLDDKPILLADEATSALDVETEKWVMKALQARREAGSAGTSSTRVSSAARGGGSHPSPPPQGQRRRTLLLIAHRLTTVKDADIIFVLRDGAIAEFGKHEVLLERNGIYSQMWQQQLEEKKGETEEAGEEHPPPTGGEG